MKPERVQDEQPITTRQILTQDFRFATFGEASHFVGQLGDIAMDDQNVEVELRGGRVTVRIAGGASDLTTRETAFMERIRGLA